MSHPFAFHVSRVEPARRFVARHDLVGDDRNPGGAKHRLGALFVHRHG